MTSDNLLKFLGNREYLHQVSYQELKSMVVQYPYSLSLRYLLAMKSQQEDNTDVDRNIELLATYGIDRSHLHRIFSEDPIVLEDLEESIIMGEDFLELKELSSLERDIDEKLAVNKVDNLNFIPEENKLTASEIPMPKSVQDLSPPPPVIENTAPEILLETNEEVTSKEEITSIKLAPSEMEEVVKEMIEDTPETAEISDLETVNELEEEFITFNFEDTEVSGETTSNSNKELAPNASFVADEVIEQDNGLPNDAIEVNDLFTLPNEPVVEDSLVEALFEEAEAEAAVSDSVAFIENPEVVLVTESELITETEEDSSLTTTSEITIEKENKTSIPFEVAFSEEDPVTFESIQEGTEIVLPEEKEVLSKKEQAIPQVNTIALVEENNNKEEVEKAAIKEEIATTTEADSVEKLVKENTPLPAKSAFNFDSLDRLEATFNQAPKLIKPAPKTKFNSWQAQYAKVGQFSGANLMPLQNGKERTIKRKRKATRKQFAKTVAFAEESLTMDTALVSETLAQLLVKQGQYSKARAMYEQLRLIMPKKSSFFAGEIEKIQNLPDEDS